MLQHCVVLVNRVDDVMVEGRVSIWAPERSSFCGNVLQPMTASMYSQNTSYTCPRSPLGQSMLQKWLSQATCPAKNGGFEVLEFHKTK